MRDDTNAEHRLLWVDGDLGVNLIRDGADGHAATVQVSIRGVSLALSEEQFADLANLLDRVVADRARERETGMFFTFVRDGEQALLSTRAEVTTAVAFRTPQELDRFCEAIAQSRSRLQGRASS